MAAEAMETNGGGNGASDYGERLGAPAWDSCVGLTAVVMLFVSFTSAMSCARGCRRSTQQTNTYVRDWIPSDCLGRCCLINTAVLLASSVTMEFARRQISGRWRWHRCDRSPESRWEMKARFPWLGITVVLGSAFWRDSGWLGRELEQQPAFVTSESQQLFRVSVTGTHAVHLAGRSVALIYAAATHVVAPPGGSAKHCGRCNGLVLAFHGFFVDLHFCALLIAR